MTTILRRRIVRPRNLPAAPQPQRQQQAQLKLQARLETDRAALKRWMTRLKRAFTTVERLQAAIARTERRLAAAR